MTAGGEIVAFPEPKRFDTALNWDEDLYAHLDGRVYPIEQWIGPDGKDCAKEDATLGIAGEGNRWFHVHLGLYGFGPWVERYDDPDFLTRFYEPSTAPVDTDRQAETALAGSGRSLGSAVGAEGDEAPLTP